MEKDGDVGEGSYTTTYRSLDSRIGRWRSVDPAANLYYSWSPYNLSMNNPIQNSDPSGATVVDPYGYVGKLETRANDIIKYQTMLKKQAEIDGKSTESYDKTIAAAQATIDEIAVLRSSSVIYKIQEINDYEREVDAGGLIEVDQSDPTYNTLLIKIFTKSKFASENNRIGKVAHELKHGYQYETGALSLETQGGGGKLYDVYDEVEAFQRQRDLGLETVPLAGRLKKKDITREQILKLPSYGDYFDKDNDFGNRNTMTTSAFGNGEAPYLGQGLKGGVWFAGKMGREPKEIFKGWQKYYNLGEKEEQYED